MSLIYLEEERCRYNDAYDYAVSARVLWIAFNKSIGGVVARCCSIKESTLYDEPASSMLIDWGCILLS